MKGLLIKDFLVLVKQMKLILIIIPLMAVTGNISIASIAILIGAMLPMTAMAYDEQSKWNELAVMMPYSRKEMILSKYIIGYLSIIGTAILFTAAKFIMSVVQPEHVHTNSTMILFSIFCGLLFLAINTPIMFRFGVQKGRIIYIIFITLSAVAGSLLKEILPGISLNTLHLLPFTAILTALILNLISIFISFRINTPK